MNVLWKFYSGKKTFHEQCINNDFVHFENIIMIALCTSILFCTVLLLQVFQCVQKVYFLLCTFYCCFKYIYLFYSSVLLLQCLFFILHYFYNCSLFSVCRKFISFCIMFYYCSVYFYFLYCTIIIANIFIYNIYLFYSSLFYYSVFKGV